MVRGRRLKSSVSPPSLYEDVAYRVKKNMDCFGEFSPPLTRSRRHARSKRLSRDSPPDNGHITDYFRIVGNSVLVEDQNGKVTPILRDDNSWERIDDFEGCRQIETESLQLDILMKRVDEKKFIINNIFKRENSLLSYGSKSNRSDIETDDADDVVVKCEPVETTDPMESPSVRLSPRKHASTLQRCAVANENNRTPHRINLCEKKASPHAIVQTTFRTHNRRTNKRSNAKAGIKKVQKTDVDPRDETPSIKVEVKEKNIKSGKINGTAEVQNHKLTEYFPVRRSVRKTKKEVMEEKKRDLELAIEEEREDGLEVASFEGKGRGVIASRIFHRGDFVVEYAGELVDLGEARIREAKYAQDHNAGCYMYYFRHNNQNYCIDATAESGRLGRLVNHSRNGNLITKSVFFNSKPHLVLIANQDILPGEEVTYDYGDRSKESLQHHPWLAL